MVQRSAGILLYRRRRSTIELFLVHPGGPFWAKKDEGAWSIPKGLVEDGEDLEAAARREFAEETGTRITGPLLDLGAFRQPSGKTVIAFSAEGDLDPAMVRSNEFEVEWPRKSGRFARFPEVDRAAWFSPDVAMIKILKGQRPIVEVLTQRLGRKVAKGGAS